MMGVEEPTSIEVSLTGYTDLGLAVSMWHAVRHQDRPAGRVVMEVTSGREVIESAAVLRQCGHEWETTVSSRTLRRSGCPFCSGHRVLSGFNDLATKRPEIAAQWHPTRNGLLGPSGVAPGSGRKVWWFDPECGHEWDATVQNRTSKGNGCRVCWKSMKVSRGARRLINVLGERLGPMQSEVPLPVEWIPDRPGQRAWVDALGTARGVPFIFEFDGPHHAGGEERDLRKTRALLRSPYADLVVRVRYTSVGPLVDVDRRHLQFPYTPGDDIEVLADRIVESIEATLSER